MLLHDESVVILVPPVSQNVDLLSFCKINDSDDLDDPCGDFWITL